MSPALVALLALPAALAGEGEAPARGAEIGLVLDLGSSPERALDSRAQRAGALLLLGALSEADHLTVFAAGSDARSPPQIALDPTQIGALVGEAGGDGEPALRAASMALWTSARPVRQLALVSAGGGDAERAAAVLGEADRAPLPRYGVSLGAEGAAWLKPVVGLGDALVEGSPVEADQGASLALDVAGALATPLQAAPQRQRWSAGAHPILADGAPTAELALMLTKVGGAPQATLVGPGGPVTPSASGVLACPAEAPPSCAPLGYASFRVPVRGEGDWRVVVPAGEVDEALLLQRPALRAALSVPDEVVAGTDEPIALVLIDAAGQPVTDPAAVLGGKVYARAFDDHAVIPLEPSPSGRLLGRWTPLGPAGRVPLRARVQSERFDLRASAETWVEGDLAPVLIPDPIGLNVGEWTGEWIETQRCAEIDLSGSVRANGLRLLCRAGGGIQDARITCEPTADQAGLEAPRRWRACVVAERCCGELPTADDAPASLHFLAADEPEAPPLLVVPVRYRVQPASFWRCNFAALLATSLLGLLLLGGLGARTRRRRFAPGVALRFSTSEPGLRRVAALYLDRAARGGGLFASERVWVDASGALCPPEDGLLALEPGPGGAAMVGAGPSLERRLQTGAWEPISEGERLQGLQPGAIYRVDARLYFMLAPA